MVTSYLGLLQKRYVGRLDPDADEFISFAMGGARRMYSLIDALLSYSRVSYTHDALEPVALEQTLREVQANLKTTIEENKAEVDSSPLPVLHVNRAQTLQLFQNLIGNAIKFRSAAPPKIRVTASENRGVWHFTISDNGIGISSEFRERIFVIFQRLHNRDEYPGTGVGLAICKRIVELHGGQIWVESTAGKGSTFHFTLPHAPAKQADAKEAETRTSLH